MYCLWFELVDKEAFRMFEARFSLLAFDNLLKVLYVFNVFDV